jgi:hypothetical protein
MAGKIALPVRRSLGEGGSEACGEHSRTVEGPIPINPDSMRGL